MKVLVGGGGRQEERCVPEITVVHGEAWKWQGTFKRLGGAGGGWMTRKRDGGRVEGGGEVGVEAEDDYKEAPH